MNGNKILAVLLGALTHFLSGWLIYGMLLMDFMIANTTTYEGLMKEDMAAIPGYALSSLIYAILLTYVFTKANVRSAGSGFSMAFILSFLLSASWNVMFYFGMNLYTGMYLIVDSFAFGVMSGIAGLVIGAVLGRNS